MEHKNDQSLDLESQEELSYLKRYKVVLLNDDFTSMDFVVEILMEVFSHQLDSAINIMLNIHREGRGVCGVYTYEIAETKISEVKKRAKENEYPLKAIMEEE
ncbi:MAG: ATP-dependent Clp protease adapter ClpS [Epsilonproteobacteria bacterium]|nr:ATP-dependent Clp protease adapter ClpS [Campylobacterota bacterium]